ncbi:helix-turn-helix domain-containing protein [Acidaminococcus timonensis]
MSRQGQLLRFQIGVEATQWKRIWLVTRAGMERFYGLEPK